MVPAGDPTESTVRDLARLLTRGDTIIDGGNSNYKDDMRRQVELNPLGLHYVDVGTSGGVWGLKEGYSLMIGGDKAEIERLRPIFETLAPAKNQGWGRMGPTGSGHFVKMIHNGIEYGIMAAIAEGLDVLRAANVGRERSAVDAETTPLRDPEHYAFDIDLAEVAEVWRRGSVVASWLLDLTAAALLADPQLKQFAGRVSDSGEGRWTIKAAIDEAVPTPVLSAALYERFSSRGDALFQAKVLSALRSEFGGHREKPAA
jgi:6-phosphogluconate dehydrogenase